MSHIHTGLYSDEAFETIRLVAALESFGYVEGHSGTNEKNVSGYFFTKIPKGATYDKTNNGAGTYWEDTAEVTRSDIDGEIIICDYATPEREKYVFPNTYAKSWARDDHDEGKMFMLHQYVGRVRSFLNKCNVKDSDGNFDIITSRSCFLEPDNYRGRWSRALKNAIDFPEMRHRYKINEETFQKVDDWFNTLQGGRDNKPKNYFDSIIGSPWDPIKSTFRAECVKQYKEYLDKSDGIVGITIKMHGPFRDGKEWSQLWQFEQNEFIANILIEIEREAIKTIGIIDF